MTHTPGPWEKYIVLGDHYGRFKGAAAVWADNRNHLIAICPDDKTIGEGQSNARLIAAAPELLEACRYAIGELNDMTTDEFSRGADKAVRDVLQDAIIKATGGQP